MGGSGYYGRRPAASRCSTGCTSASSRPICAITTTASTCAPSTRRSGSSTRTWSTTTSACSGRARSRSGARLLRPGRLRRAAAGGAETAQELVFFGGYENVNPRSQMSSYNYNPPAITGRAAAAPRAVAVPVFRARRHRLPAAARARAQGRPSDRARRRRPAAGAPDDHARRAGDASPARPRAGCRGARNEPPRPGDRLLLLKRGRP